MVFAIGGAMLAARAVEEQAESRVATGVGLALLAALFLGGLSVTLDAGGDRDPVWTIFMVRVSSVIALWVVVAIRRPSFERVRPNLFLLVAAGLLDNTANLMFALATSRGLLSVVAVLSSLYPVTTVLLARFVLRERMHPWQLAGVAAALGGVSLISLG